MCSHTGAHRVAQLVYVPIYDQSHSQGSTADVQGVLEIMVDKYAGDAMIVANAITFIGAVLDYLQVSTASPQQQEF